VLEKFPGHDVSNTTGCATTTGVIPVILKIVAVVEGDLLPCPDIAQADNPNIS